MRDTPQPSTSRHNELSLLLDNLEDDDESWIK